MGAPLALAVAAMAFLAAGTACSSVETGIAAQGAVPSAGPKATHKSTPNPAPSPGAMDTPATSAGPLSQRSFPTPPQLGSGWEYSVDQGDAEEGYLGNGTPALARDPRELVQAALPLGCPRRLTLPVPRHALEVDYSYHGTKVVAVRMSFADQAQATGFYGARNAALMSCHGRSGGAAIGVLVSEVNSVGQHAVLSDRTPRSDPWTELAVLAGDSVVLLAAQTGPGEPPLSDAQAPALAKAFGG
jgi:hypothetical protein